MVYVCLQHEGRTGQLGRHPDIGPLFCLCLHSWNSGNFRLFQIAEHLFLYVNNDGLLNSYYRSPLFSVRMEEGQNHYQGLFPGRKVHAVAPGKIGLASFATKCYNFLALKNNDCFCFCQKRNCKK